MTIMAKTLRIPDEPRFVHAFALVVDPGDTLGLLMEIGALGSPDPSTSLWAGVGIVRRTREALLPAYDQASDQKDWEQIHTISVLREALAQSDSAAYLAYRVRANQQAAHTATDYAEALAVVGCAADTLSSRCRPWEIEPNEISLPDWRKRVWKLLFGLPGTALPKPTEPHPPAEAACTCNEPGSHRILAGEHADWCPADTHQNERSKQP
jgi:hypothetical protein